MAPAADCPLASAVAPPPVLLRSGAAPPAPKGARDRTEHGSPKTAPPPKNSCRGRPSSPRFGARVARLKPPRIRKDLVSAASMFTLNVVALGATSYEEYR